MSITPIPQVFFPVLAVYFVLMAYLGYLSSKKTDSIREFLAMGGTAGALVAGLAYMTTQYSMSTFMGVPGTIYMSGWAIAGMTLTGAFSLWLPTALVGGRLIKLRDKLDIYTLPDYLASRYDSRFIRIVVSVIIVVYILPTMGAQTIGAGVIWHLFTGQPEWVGVGLMAGIVTVYCLTGGIRGAMLTDVAQAALMTITAITLLVAVLYAGGGVANLSEQLAALDVGKMSFPGSPVQACSYKWLFSQLFLWSFFTIGMPQLVTKFFAMRNYKVAVRSSILAGVGMGLASNLIYMVAAFIPIFLKDVPATMIDYVVPAMAVKMLPNWLAATMMAGLLAAGMSTIDSMLVITSGSLVRDIYHNFINREATDEKLLGLIRWVTLACGAAAFVIGVVKPGTIFQLILFTWGGLGVLTIPVVLGVRWKRATKEGALVGIIVGEIYHALATKVSAWSFGFHPGVPSLLVTFVVMVLVSLMTSAPSRKTLEEHFT